MPDRENDTICAISTPLGMGGIGIVRLSGGGAFGILERIFSFKDGKSGLKSHRIYYGNVINPEDGTVVDEALATVMKAPRTYTREDVVEINCHGGPAAVRKVLELAVKAGAMLAEPGEFTKRAYLNGRIDLTQAEAVMDVIASKTEASLAAAVSQLGGALRQRIEEVREDLANLLALTEVSIDFPEEEIEYVPAADLAMGAARAREKIDRLISTYDEGRLLREGLRLAIVGAPNVGKSSLLNLLTKSDRAIVTDVPGTTRDTVEETVNLGGVPVRLIDTAGIRHSEDVVEKEGIKRSEKAILDADLVLFVLDGSREVNAQDIEIVEKIRGKDPLSFTEKKGNKENEFILLVNKSDLPQKINLKVFGCYTFYKKGSEVSLSSKTGSGLDELIARIKEAVFSGGLERAPEAAINLRHKVALEDAAAALGRFDDGCKKGLSQEFLALELRDALDAVGEIVGTTAPEDILNRIFNDFCIGK